MIDNQIFRELGFTEREIKVYLALLELGSITIGPISTKTGLQPSKIYETLNKLIEKGLVSYIVISKTKHFKAADPKQILSLIEEKRRRFNDILEELESKQKFSESKQIAVVHEGYKAFRALFNRIADEIKPKESYWAFAFKYEYHDETTSLFLRSFHKRLEEKKVDDRALGHIEVKRQIKEAFEGNKNIKLKFTNNETPLGLIIIKNKVISLIWGDRPTAIEITSEQVYEQYKRFFAELWNKAKK